MILHDKRGRAYEHTFTGEEIARALSSDLTNEESWRKTQERWEKNHRWWHVFVRMWRALFPRPRYKSTVTRLNENGEGEIIKIGEGGLGDDYDSCMWVAICQLEWPITHHYYHASGGQGKHPYSKKCTRCVNIYDEVADYVNRCHHVTHERLPRSEWRKYGDYEYSRPPAEA